MQKNEYKSIIKVISIFGSLQIIQIILTLMKGKISALLIGASGIGLSAIFSNTLNIGTVVFGLGLNLSYVKSFSKYYDDNDYENLEKEISILNKWINILSLLGISSFIICSSLFSLAIFKNLKESISFIIIGIGIYFNIKNILYLSILQGTKKFKEIAKSSLISGIISFIIILPLYYYFRIKAISVSLVLASIINYFLLNYFFKKLDIKIKKVKNTYLLGKENAKLGIALILTTFINGIVNYIIIIFISKVSGSKVVGLYQAGQSITMQYTSLITSALVIEYFPRLCSVSNDNKKIKKIVNDELEIIIYLSLPIILFIINFSDIIIKLLLSKEFIIIVKYVKLLACAMFIKMIAFPIAYISFAKSDKKVFVLFESFIGNGLILFATICGFYLKGIEGIGYLTFFSYTLYLIMLLIVTFKKYKFLINKEYLKLIVYSFILIFISLLLDHLKIKNKILLLILIFLISCGISIKRLIKKMGIDIFLHIKKK